METTIYYPPKKLNKENKAAQANWQRLVLLIVLSYESVGCLLGGSFLMAAPDGSLMSMPVDIMHGAFSNFLIPGIILFSLGIVNLAAVVAVFRKTGYAWVLAALALGGLAIWFWVEIAILLELHWLHAMWGLPVLLGGAVMIPLVPSVVIQRGLLACGILSSALYVIINVVVPLQWVSYDSASQTVSELSAIGAPTRMLWSVLVTPYTFLMLAFAWGVRKSAGENRRLRIAGGYLVAYGALGILWPFAPMHLRETLATGGATSSDTVHILLGATTEVLFILALSYATASLGKRFRFYSFATLAALVIFGALTFLDAPGIARNEPTPLIGVWERVNIGLFLAWVGVLAVRLLQRECSRSAKVQ